jgi:predicted TIM-barrel fold metal-dependent hydrolase
MSDTLFYDAFTRIGPRTGKHLAHAWKLSDVLAEMDHCSISAALVASTTSVSYDLMFSNLELSDRIKPHRHLSAIWNVMPHQTGEFPATEELGRLMRENDVKAVTIYPKSNAWEWSADHSDVLLSWLQRNHVLTIVEKSEFADYVVLDRFLGRYSKLPVLLLGAHWAEQRLVLPLLQKYRNLHIAFDQFQIHYGLEYLVSIGCEDQLVFATNAPLMSMGAHRCYVDYAEIPEAAKRKIAGGNLMRLIGCAQAPPQRVNANEDAIMTAARAGKPLPVPLIDMHMHILHEGMNGGGMTVRMQHGGPKGVVALLQRLGCIGGGFMSWNGVISADSLGGNETVKQCLDAVPPGFWGLANFDPTHYTQDELRVAIPALYEDRRFIGMKPYHIYGVEYHHPSYDVWWEFGNARRFYALMHRNRNDFAEIEALAKKYPDVRWVVAHCGADFKTADQAVETIKKYPNVYAEITLTPVAFGVIDYLVANAGEDRIVYGSDLPMRDPRQQLGWVVFSRLSVAQKRKVLAENALRVIAPCLDRLPERNRPKNVDGFDVSKRH